MTMDIIYVSGGRVVTLELNLMIVVTMGARRKEIIMSFEEALELFRRERGCWNMPVEECDKFITCKDCEYEVDPKTFREAVNVILVAYGRQ